MLAALLGGILVYGGIKLVTGLRLGQGRGALRRRAVDPQNRVGESGLNWEFELDSLINTGLK